MPGEFTARVVVCPSCAGKSIYSPENTYRPFCSARCKGVDLGAWASEEFRVPARDTPDGEPQPEPPLQ